MKGLSIMIRNFYWTQNVTINNILKVLTYILKKNKIKFHDFPDWACQLLLLRDVEGCIFFSRKIPNITTTVVSSTAFVKCTMWLLSTNTHFDRGIVSHYEK